MALRAFLASATMGMSTSMFFPISAVSMSMWIFLDGAQKLLSLPVARSENLVPTASITSASQSSLLATGFPCMPILPRDRGWVSGKAPLPIKVVATGAISSSAVCSSSGAALEVMTPPPARMAGCSASANISAAFLIWRGCGLDVGLYPRIWIPFEKFMSAISVCTFFGTSMRTGPGLPVVAM